MAVESSNDIYALPEDCIATALSLTSPKDVCRLSAVASTFRSASQSDAVWARFLPSDYPHIISRALDGGDSLLSKFHSKKDLYLHLCDHPLLIDDGRKSFQLEKLSGKKCYMLSARDLSIVWGDTQYWRFLSLPESRFPEVAELLDVCWFEIRGKIEMSMLSLGTNYAAYLVFTCRSMVHGFDHQSAEGYVKVSGSGSESEKRSVCLDPDGARRRRHQRVPRREGLFYRRLTQMRNPEAMLPDGEPEYPKQRGDGWMEVELGECFVEEGQDGELEVSVMEVKGGNWKSGIIIQGIEIRPKESK
ncbi:putative F-box protein PP2-B12 [Salvia splendens]|uniref:putative F-box protein PP2-B12 n=1 Tax=Salvia splendens TaxID=180675 RepID=UPI0011001AF5|nr:putative F-box protein PP2-B12 [Salvia splendens]